VSNTDNPPPDTGDDAPTIMNGVNAAVPVDNAVDVDVDIDDEIELADPVVGPSPAPMKGDDAATVPVAVLTPTSSPAPGAGDAAPTLVPGIVVVASPVAVASPVVAASPVVDAAPAATSQTVLGTGDDAATVLPVRASGVPPPTILAGPGVTAATAAALAGLKPSSSLTSSGGVAPATAAALAGLKPSSKAPASASASTSTATAASTTSGGLAAVDSSRPAVRPATRSMSPPRPGGPPSIISPEKLKQVAVTIVVAVAAVAALLSVVLRPPAEPDLPLVRLPITATDCQRLKSEGKALHCEAAPLSLNGLKAADREERLRQTRDLARAGGFEKVVFEEKGRVWRVLLLRDAPAATTGTGPAATP
jgi:hypothetical protein